jgi:hypothetical protein
MDEGTFWQMRLEQESHQSAVQHETTMANLMSGLAQSQVEEGVASIELAASSTWNREYKPVDGRVKWFRDDMGQVWVKFQALKDGHLLDRVWLASRVVEVTYDKGEFRS